MCSPDIASFMLLHFSNHPILFFSIFFQECVDAANSGRLGMDAMLRSSSTLKVTASGGTVQQRNMLGHLSTGNESSNNPLGEHRDRLRRGNLFAHWGENGQRFVYATPDFSALAWKKQGAKRAKDISSIPISDIKLVKSGRRNGGHRRGTREAEEDRAFFIVSGSGSSLYHLDLEASTTVERDRWVEAIQTWSDAHHRGEL